MYDDHRFDLAAEQYLAEDFVAHSVERELDREEVAQMNAGAVVAFPDVRFAVEDVIAEGDKVVARVTVTGTNLGPLATSPDAPPVPPTGRSVTTSLILIARVEGDKIVEAWRVEDEMAIMRQLGLTPDPGTG
jgi:C-1 hydroxylase